jgi:CDP-diacylglycerol--glycerol-3-phosphate 3-phosphatidyltransferase
VQLGLVPAWMAAIIIGRDLAVTALRNRAYSRGVPMPASPLGKIKMAAQVVAILVLILGEVYLPGMFVVGRVALWVVVIAALVSGFDYFRRFSGVTSAPVADLPVAHEQRSERKAG